jgi:uncharacterized protein
MPFLTEMKDGVRIQVHAQPGAKRTEIVGIHGDALKIRIAAVPEDGQANAQLLEFIARLLDAPVSLVSGAASRSKVVFVSGVRAADVRRILNQMSSLH